MNHHLQPHLPPESRRRNVAVFAVLVSLLTHFAIYHYLGHHTFTFFEPILEKFRDREAAAPPTRTEVMQPEEESVPLEDPLLIAGAQSSFAPTDPEVLLERLSGTTPAAVFEPPDGQTAAETTALLNKLAPEPAEELPPWQPRAEIMSIANPPERSAMAPLPRREIHEIERREIAPDITLSYDLLSGLTEAGDTSGDSFPALQAPETVKFALTAPLPTGGEEDMPVPRLGPEAEGETSTALVAEIPASVAVAYPLEDRLRISVETWKADRRSDGYLYFLINVFRKDGEALPGLPRDIVFVQDTSGSLGERYLVPCRRALHAMIETLGPEDRFNIVQFSDQITRCFDDWQHPTTRATAEARLFIDDMKSAGNTDLFGSVAEVLSLPRDPVRPMVALVISDGRATMGQLERDSQIIGAFTRLNAGNVSVFSVGTSPRANRFLLDMLSYCNRGSQAEIARDRFSVTDSILAMDSTIQRPLLAEVRFNFDVVSKAEVYPVLTTNLYEDRPLQLFGRVAEDQSTVAFQARGQAGQDRYDMLFEVDLLDPANTAGSKELRTMWATQRMYELVARFARTEEIALIAEMRKLGREYHIPIPYSSRFR